MPRTQSLILNVSTSARVDRVLAKRAIEACSAVWEVMGVSIRNVSEEEACELRNQQARKRRIPERALAYAEVFGVIYRPALSAAAAHPMELGLALQADHFAMVASAAEAGAS